MRFVIKSFDVKFPIDFINLIRMDIQISCVFDGFAEEDQEIKDFVAVCSQQFMSVQRKIGSKCGLRYCETT